MGLIKQQNGSVALVMVVVLMTMGLIFIKSLHFYQERAFEEWRKEVRYFSGFNRAESALAWGATLLWDIHSRNYKTWFCQQNTNRKWKSCLKHYKGSNFILSGQSDYQFGLEIKVYRWVILDVNKQQVIPRSKGWLDYCPVTKKGFCQ
ncbi:DUF2509 family protein [Providencia alcalifaciens]|uniref:DUF2509 family protein n=1 Tax=Providencia TaxID=586 RepID=UPI00197DE263|nr:DUF2509 family protein [Providencia rettgeri]MBN6350071.1 DUF2509 family protein [Providencia rettgeri]